MVAGRLGLLLLLLLLLLKLVPCGTDSAVALLRCRRTRLVLVHPGLGHTHKDAGTRLLLLLRIDPVAEPGRGVVLPHVHAPLGTSGELADVVHGLVAPRVGQFGALPGQFTLGEVASLGGHDHVRGSNLSRLLLTGKATVVVHHRILLLLLLLLLLKLLRLLLMVRMHWGKTGLVELLLLLDLLLLLRTHHVDADKVGPPGLGWRSRVGPPHRTRHGQWCRDAERLDSLLHRGRRRRIISPSWHSLLVLLLLLDRNHRRWRLLLIWRKSLRREASRWIESPLARVRTVPRVIHPNVLPRRIAATVLSTLTSSSLTAIHVHASVAVHRRQEKVTFGTVPLQRRRRLAVPALGALRLHIDVGPIPTGR